MLRVAMFSPMPPAKSGIADYSAALAEPLTRLVQLDVLDRTGTYDPSRHDCALYQIGNNQFHTHAYEEALRVPGVVVLHEANLHHLMAERTIKRGDWDAYLREVEYDGGAAALQFARRVRKLEVGPDYDGVPMLKRLMERSLGVIAHSRCVAEDARRHGFSGPLAVIPHGAWIPQADRMGFRHRLGLGPDTPLVGIFGFLKPYKRVAESLRAFRRVVKLEPRARMILVGEPHPDFPVQRLIQTLGLEAHVRLLGFTPIEEFVGYIAACDIVLNLRYPTVGESSGTLLRSLGLGKAVVVSNIGSFAEYPDDVVLKAPVDAREEDFLFEYLSLLVERSDVRSTLGESARQWVERECSWDLVARRYATFLEAVLDGRDWVDPGAAVTAGEQAEHKPSDEAIAVSAAVQEPAPAGVTPEYLLGWAEDEGGRGYIETHITRLEKTLELTPPGGDGDRVLEMGAYLQITPSLKTRLGYGEVRGCYYGPAGKVDSKRVVSADGEVFACDVDLFDAEMDRFPYQDEWFATVLCCELIEHLPNDPMHMMAEINRILRPGGHLLLTTPNIASLRALAAVLQGYHPGFFPAYLKPPADGEEQTDARHNREYTAKEVAMLFYYAGLEMVRLETGPFLEKPEPEHHWVRHLLEQYRLPSDLRGDGIYALGRKTGPIRERYPAFLYS